MALVPSCGSVLAAVPLVAKNGPAPIVLFDQTALFSLDLKDEAQRRRFWDESHLAVCLQGLANRHGPRLFIRYLKNTDDFWWEQMTQPGGWLHGRPVLKVSNLEELLDLFPDAAHGAVVWDERVPATSNLASTIAGCDDLLALRFDDREGSLCQRLVRGPRALPVKVRLLRDDGSALFTGSGQIPGTAIASTGSAKADAYRWLIERYLKTGKVDPHLLGYYLDGFWLKRWNLAGPENHTLSNHDFIIARRGLCFDLNVWDDEPCVDDPAQRPGTDGATLRELLRAAYNRFGGDGLIHAAGFVPWAYKYTNHGQAGGKHGDVATEWRYAQILSCFNAYMDADALGLGAMPNASFYQHFPLAKRYPQNPKPTRESLRAAGLLDANGRIVPRAYIGHYVGDYDSAAWLYHELPRMWRDPARGGTPLSWAFNPNLAERFPLGMAWARGHRTTNDWFVAGDSGAGYLNPGDLTPPRPFSGLPSGLAAWEHHCERFYSQWDLSLTGFVIDGDARGLAPETLDAYARFSPDGIVAQRIAERGVHRGMPFVRMKTDLPENPEQAARVLYGFSEHALPAFFVCRSILRTPGWYAEVERRLRESAGDRVRIVDLYSLLWLVREFETNSAARPLSPFAGASELHASPGRLAGLTPVLAGDGPWTIALEKDTPGWLLPRREPPGYLYLCVDKSWRPNAGAESELALEYLDRGHGHIVMEYDSTDAQATLTGAYKPHPTVIERAGSGEWRRAVFSLRDARFDGRQNEGADFRFYNGGDELLIRSVAVRRVPGGK